MDKNARLKIFCFEKCNWIVFTVFVIGIGIVSSLSYLSAVSRDFAKYEKFSDKVSHIEHTIQDNFDFYVKILNSAAGFFAGSDLVNRSEWDSYMSRLDPGTFGKGVGYMGYISRVPSGSKDDFIRTIRADFNFYKYLADYEIHPFRESGDYYPVNYIYPLSGFESALGYDFNSNIAMSGFFGSARDSGKLEAAGPFSFSGNGQDPYGKNFLVLLPIYKNGFRTDTVEARRLALQGFVVLGISPREFVNYSLNLRQLQDELNLAVFNGAETEEGDLLYSNYSRLPEFKDFKNHKFSKEFIFRFNGSVWTFYFSPKGDFALGDFRDRFPSVILVIGIIFLLLISKILHLLLSSRSVIEKHVREALGELEKSQVQYRNLVDSASDPIVIIDEFGVIEYINRAGTDIIGYASEDLVGKTILETETVDITDLSKVLDHFKADLRGEKTLPFDLNMIKKDGQRIILEANSSLLSGNVKMIQVLFRDVTRKRLEEGELKKYSENLERINKLMVDRELKMMGLKEELEKLKNKNS